VLSPVNFSLGVLPIFWGEICSNGAKPFQTGIHIIERIKPKPQNRYAGTLRLTVETRPIACAEIETADVNDDRPQLATNVA
jgi:hypothetical protein